MDDRDDQVAGAVVADLDDELAQIRLDDLHPRLLQRGRELDFLAGHRLALDAALAVRRSGDLGDDPLGLVAVGGEMDVAAVLHHVLLKLLKVIIEMIQGVLLDAPGQIAQGFGVGQFPQAQLLGRVLAQGCAPLPPL